MQPRAPRCAPQTAWAPKGPCVGLVFGFARRRSSAHTPHCAAPRAARARERDPSFPCSLVRGSSRRNGSKFALAVQKRARYAPEKTTENPPYCWLPTGRGVAAEVAVAQPMMVPPTTLRRGVAVGLRRRRLEPPRGVGVGVLRGLPMLVSGRGSSGQMRRSAMSRGNRSARRWASKRGFCVVTKH